MKHIKTYEGLFSRHHHEDEVKNMITNYADVSDLYKGNNSVSFKYDGNVFQLIKHMGWNSLTGKRKFTYELLRLGTYPNGIDYRIPVDASNSSLEQLWNKLSV